MTELWGTVDSGDDDEGATRGAAKVAPAPINAATVGTITAWTIAVFARCSGFDGPSGGGGGGPLGGPLGG